MQLYGKLSGQLTLCSITSYSTAIAEQKVMNNPLIAIDGLGVSLDNGGRRLDVLRGLNLKVQKGEFLSILGPSG